jgi:hypothetical protein
MELAKCTHLTPVVRDIGLISLIAVFFVGKALSILKSHFDCLILIGSRCSTLPAEEKGLDCEVDNVPVTTNPADARDEQRRMCLVDLFSNKSKRIIIRRRVIKGKETNPV